MSHFLYPPRLSSSSYIFPLLLFFFDPHSTAKEKESDVAREKQEKETAAAAQAGGATAQAHQQQQQAKAKAAASQLGGFGLLYAVGAEAHLFKKSQQGAGSGSNNSSGRVLGDGEVDKEAPRLFQIKGRRNIFVRQVEVSYTSLNKGDVFLLDAGKTKATIYQWNGSEANRIEKGKGMDVAKSIKDKERSGVSRVVVLDDGKSEHPEELEYFWKILGGKVAPPLFFS